MSENKDGGPAFPQAEAEYMDHPTHGHIHKDVVGMAAHPGMSLRDYFAGKALAGICTGCGFQGGPWDNIARDAYLAADAMLAQRAKVRP